MLLILRPPCFCKKNITVQCRTWKMLLLSLKGILMGRLLSQKYMSRQGVFRDICQQNYMNKTIVINLNSAMPNHKWVFHVICSLRICSNIPLSVSTSDFIHICLTLLMSSFSSQRIQMLLFPLLGTYKCTCIYAYPIFFPPITYEVSHSWTFSGLFPSCIRYLLILNLLEFF